MQGTAQKRWPLLGQQSGAVLLAQKAPTPAQSASPSQVPQSEAGMAHRVAPECVLKQKQSVLLLQLPGLPLQVFAVAAHVPRPVTHVWLVLSPQTVPSVQQIPGPHLRLLGRQRAAASFPLRSAIAPARTPPVRS